MPAAEHGLEDAKVLDCHCHVASTRFVPRQFLEGIARNMQRRMRAMGNDQPLSRIVDLIVSQYQDHLADGLVAEMDEAGIEQAILLLPDFTYVFPSELTIEAMVGLHAEIKARHPGRFFIFYGVDPRWGAEGLALFERCVAKHGLDGMKIYPPAGYSPSSSDMYPYYEICRQQRVPVLTHTGPTSPTLRHDFGNLALVDQAAFDFPEVNFILAHAAVNNVEAAVLACGYRDNVYLDTSGYLGVLSADGLGGHLRRLFSLGLNHKILFGTDYPVFMFGGNQARALGAFRSAGEALGALPRRDVQMIMRENALSLLHPEARDGNS